MLNGLWGVDKWRDESGGGERREEERDHDKAQGGGLRNERDGRGEREKERKSVRMREGKRWWKW